jgi:hypothetical protein
METRKLIFIVGCTLSLPIFVWLSQPLRGKMRTVSYSPSPSEVSVAGIPFIANKGQLHENIEFYTLIPGQGAVFVTKKGKIIYSLQTMEGKSGGGRQWASFEEKLVGGAVIESNAGRKMVTTVNFFNGNKPTKWRKNVSTYDSVNLGEVYAGINVRLISVKNSIEKYFLIEPGSDPTCIRIKIEGAKGLEIDKAGNLEINTGRGGVVFTKPVAYQEVNGNKRYIDTGYVIFNNFEYGFTLGIYDRLHLLVIDPLLMSTYLGGSGNEGGRSLAVDSNGNVYVVGNTDSSGFHGCSDAAGKSFKGGAFDVFIARYDSDLQKLLSCTFIGGSRDDIGKAIAINKIGDIYVAGVTASPDFPTSHNAFDKTFNGGETDSFVLKLSRNLSTLSGATFLGGSRSENMTRKNLALRYGQNKGIYVTGVTASADYPTTVGVYDRTYNGGALDIFITKLDMELNTLKVSTFIGGKGYEKGFGITLDPHGSIYIAGQCDSEDYPTTPGAYDKTHNGTKEDIFVSKLDGNLKKLMASTFLGGKGTDNGYCMTIDNSGNIYVAGHADPGFPTTPGVYAESSGSHNKASISKFNSNLSKLLASTYFGVKGNGLAVCSVIGVDKKGSVYVAGYTRDVNFTTTIGAFDETQNGGVDIFLSKFNTNLTKLLSSTFIGGSGEDEGVYSIAFDKDENILLTGFTGSTDFPTTSQAHNSNYNGQGDVFLIKITNDLSKF